MSCFLHGQRHCLLNGRSLRLSDQPFVTYDWRLWESETGNVNGTHGSSGPGKCFWPEFIHYLLQGLLLALNLKDTPGLKMVPTWELLLQLLFYRFFNAIFEMRSHIAQACLALIMQLTITLNFWSSCLYLTKSQNHSCVQSPPVYLVLGIKFQIWQVLSKHPNTSSLFLIFFFCCFFGWGCLVLLCFRKGLM